MVIYDENISFRRRIYVVVFTDCVYANSFMLFYINILDPLSICP